MAQQQQLPPSRAPQLTQTFESTETFSQEFRANMHTKIVPTTSKLLPGTFKTQPCWKHLLNLKKKKSRHHKCNGKDVACEGQHPDEHRDLINDLRQAKGLEPLPKTNPIFGYLSMADQDRVLDEKMHALGWISHSPVHAHITMGTPITGNVQAELTRLQAENKSLQEQVEATFDKYAGNYAENPHQRMAQLMTRNAILETELENYQKYMRTVTKQNNSAKQKLERKIKELKRTLRN